jgi:hypothetical protein
MILPKYYLISIRFDALVATRAFFYKNNMM